MQIFADLLVSLNDYADSLYHMVGDIHGTIVPSLDAHFER